MSALVNVDVFVFIALSLPRHNTIGKYERERHKGRRRGKPDLYDEGHMSMDDDRDKCT